MKNIKLLDCTLRDGAYIVDGNFGEVAIRGIIAKLQEARVDIIECGWLKDFVYSTNSTYYHTPFDLLPYISNKSIDTIYTAMIDWDRYNLTSLPLCDGKSIDAIRIVFPRGKHIQGIEVGRYVQEKGYKVFFQLANTLAYSEEELIEISDLVNEIMPEGISVVDTFGAMYHTDLERIVRVLDERLEDNIALGFHSHNNQQLSFALSMHFVELLKASNREVIIDCSLCGMGRGAGNATTELMANYLNKNKYCNYDMDAIMDAIDVYMKGFQEKYQWGYSTQFFVAGMYGCHVNNIAYLMNNHSISSKDLRNVIGSLSTDECIKYDYELLEEKYIENQNRIVEDMDTIQYLTEIFSGKEIVLIAPGKSSTEMQTEIHKYIKNKNNIVTIAVNALLKEYSYDYLFLTSMARYEYAYNNRKEQFEKTEKILLSNIKITGKEDEYIVNYNRAIKRGWKHFDNAVICCLRLLDRLNVKKVSLVGFDGFKEKYNESYADTNLPAIEPGEKWEELNEEIMLMFQDVKSVAHSMQISFLTKSIFNK